MSISITETPHFALGIWRVYAGEEVRGSSARACLMLGSALGAFTCIEAGGGGSCALSPCPPTPVTWSLNVIHSVVQCEKV